MDTDKVYLKNIVETFLVPIISLVLINRLDFLMWTGY